MWRDQVVRAGGPEPRRASGDDGAVLVEAAFVLPILVFLIFGIYAVCLMYNAKTELTGAVREGARSAALKQKNTGDANVTDTAQKAVIKAAPGLNQLKQSDITVTECPTTPVPTNNATVKATYEVNFVVPFLRQTSVQVSAEGVMRCGL
jgi:Flp pilus assembly protein TadG